MRTARAVVVPKAMSPMAVASLIASLLVAVSGWALADEIRERVRPPEFRDFEVDVNLEFDVARDATMHVAFDPRGEGTLWPDWLTDGDFRRTDMTIRTDDGTLVVLAKELTAGRVTLGPNAATSGSSSSYVTVLVARGRQT